MRHSTSLLFTMATAVITTLLLLTVSEAKFRDSDNLFEESFHVKSLTDASFDAMRLNQTDEVWLVDFYAPWCPHCRVFAPELEKIATFYAGSKSVRVGAVDCTQHATACNSEEVMGYPTLKLFHVPAGSTKGKRYNSFGLKTMQGIVKWVEDLLAEAQMPAGVQDDNVDQQLELIRHDRVSDGLGLPSERSLQMKYARLQDAGAAAIFTLENSLFIGKSVLEGERYSAALLWIQALGASFPLEANRQVFRDLAQAMEARKSWDQSAWKSLIDKWKAIARTTTFPKSLLVYEEETAWAHCNTYTCGLWTLFHSMSVTAGTPACPLKPSQVAVAIRFFVEHFFGCEECVKHFLAANPPKVITTLAESDTEGNTKLVMWLWKMHNQVNKVTKKDFWPSVKSCPVCFADNVRTPTLDPATLHEHAIVNFVTAIYEQSEDDVWTMNYQNNGLGAALRDSAAGFSTVMVVVIFAVFVVAAAGRAKTVSFFKREHAA
jgi:thiol oxidase